MSRTLLVTNDYPPKIGGIQSYLRDFVATLDPEDTVVFASTQDAAAAAEHDADVAHEVIRWPHWLMAPTPGVAKRMGEIIAARDVDTVWFGAAAPLAVLASSARAAGATRTIASTHGHEVGWSMLPGARQVLRRIGDDVDVVTYISDYTLGRIRPAIGERTRYEHLPSGVDTEVFRPATEQERAQTRARFGVGEEPLIVCVSRLVPRKGQDQLIRALPELRRRHPGTRLAIVGVGSYESTLRVLAEPLAETEPDAVLFTGALSFTDMRDLLAAADVFAMPARTRGAGLDVEGLGIVYLEAQACGVPVVAGDSGGAPDTVTPETGLVVDGRSVRELIGALDRVLADASLRARMGRAGRAHVQARWTWEIMGRRLNDMITH